VSKRLDGTPNQHQQPPSRNKSKLPNFIRSFRSSPLLVALLAVPALSGCGDDQQDGMHLLDQIPDHEKKALISLQEEFREAIECGKDEQSIKRDILSRRDKLLQPLGILGIWECGEACVTQYRTEPRIDHYGDNFREELLQKFPNIFQLEQKFYNEVMNKKRAFSFEEREELLAQYNKMTGRNIKAKWRFKTDTLDRPTILSFSYEDEKAQYFD
jgi:hypothetical protein